MCLAYSQRYPSTAADDLSIAAINLLSLAVQAGESALAAPNVALIQSMVHPSASSKSWRGCSLLAQLKASQDLLHPTSFSLLTLLQTFGLSCSFVDAVTFGNTP